MSLIVDFIKGSNGSKYIEPAQRQQRQINYFICSNIESDFQSSQYFSNWLNRNNSTNDYFLNYIKSIFKKDVALNFAKNLRFPLASAKLVNNSIEKQLRRVFNSEDFNFYISDKEKESIDYKCLIEEIFDNYLYNHNSIIVVDVNDKGEPFYYIVDIQNVIAIDANKNTINKIAYKTNYVDKVSGETKQGIAAIDSEKYYLFDTEYNIMSENSEGNEHYLGYCPAFFVSDKHFKTNDGINNFVLRKSLFSYERERIENYVFLHTILKYVEPNGGVPVIAKIDTNNNDNINLQNDSDIPVFGNLAASQRPKLPNNADLSDSNNIGVGVNQPGVLHEIPIESLRDQNGTINMDVLRNFLNYFYIPIEALNYLNDKVKQVEEEIVSNIVGDYLESNQSAKNETQIKQSISILENVLRDLSYTISKCATNVLQAMYDLKFGVDEITVYLNMGSDFFIDTTEMLLSNFEKAANPYERRNIIMRINTNQYKNDKTKSDRAKVLYEIIPFVADKDFEAAKKSGITSKETEILYLQFNYVINLFESKYGDIVEFVKEIENKGYSKFANSGKNSLVLLNNLVYDIINENFNLNKDGIKDYNGSYSTENSERDRSQGEQVNSTTND